MTDVLIRDVPPDVLAAGELEPVLSDVPTAAEALRARDDPDDRRPRDRDRRRIGRGP